VATLDDDEAKKQVQEATWEWIQRIIVLAVTFGLGFFAAWIQWGSGLEGAPALRLQKVEMESQILEMKNKRVDLDGKITVISSRLEECQKTLNKTQGGGAAP
jgi:hypothetical protein